MVILGFFVTIMAMNTMKFNEDVKIAAALKDMSDIQTAITHGLHPDLGNIPCNADYSDKSIEALFVPAYLFLEREEIKDIVETTEKCVKGEYKEYIDPWNKYQSSGLGGPYMKYPPGVLDATYFDEVNFPKDSEGRHAYMGALLTPWADKCEQMASDAEQEGELELAMEYRKGKYYQIYSPQKIVIPGCVRCLIKESHNQNNPDWRYTLKCNPRWQSCECKEDGYWKNFCTIIRDNAYIICRGADCLPPPTDTGDRYVDVAARLRCEAKIGEDAVEGCKNYAEAECAQPFRLPVKCESCLQNQFKICIKQEHDNAYPVPLEKMLSIMNPGYKGYMDIGDDLIMSVFGSVVRSPMDE